ncbi:alpha/beta hydrolase family esterase [Leifsonia poae]|uniref:alpha/beta hydrolase family esterase n=1 Tax=Leifsonia poae TaxID=110933 RepID=UPI001CBAD455|nr:hypothetical protein [Leifsonia poae]
MDVSPPVTERRTVTVDARERTLLLVRDEHPAEHPALVLLFHGSNQTGERLREFAGRAFDGFTTNGSAIVAYLDGYGKHWNDARTAIDFAARRDDVDDAGFAAAVIDFAVARFGVDRGRVFAVGYSNGGQLVERLLLETPERLAGAALIAATLPAAENLAVHPVDGPAVPTVLFHGTKDPLVPYDGGMASLWGFRPRGLGVSALATAAFFAKRNGITAVPTTAPLRHRVESGPTRVERTDYRQNGHAPVTLYTIVGGGHTIPGSQNAPRTLGATAHDIDAAALIADFFALTRAAPTRPLR